MSLHLWVQLREWLSALFACLFLCSFFIILHSNWILHLNSSYHSLMLQSPSFNWSTWNSSGDMLGAVIRTFFIDWFLSFVIFLPCLLLKLRYQGILHHWRQNTKYMRLFILLIQQFALITNWKRSNTRLRVPKYFERDQIPGGVRPKSKVQTRDFFQEKNNRDTRHTSIRQPLILLKSLSLSSLQMLG